MVFIVYAFIIYVGHELLSYILSVFFNKAFPSASKWFLEKKRKEYFGTLIDNSFRKFKTDVLKRYYSDVELIVINGRTFPVCIFPYHSKKYEELDSAREDRWIKKYDSIINKKESDEFQIDLAEHQLYKHFRGYLWFHLIMKENVKFPDRPCFMLKKLEVNESDEMTSVSVSIGTYGENMYSNQILEYELFSLYKKYGSINIENANDTVWNSIQNQMVLRNAKKKQKDQSTMEFLCDGRGRYSMFAVQMLVLIREGNSFKVMIFQRSKTVAVAPGDYQMVPAGAFEIFNNNKPEYAKHDIIANLSPGTSVFREYLEEIIGEKGCEGNGPGGVSTILTKNKELQKVFELLDNKKAAFRFLGVVADLVYLRDYLSFVLVIADPEYARNTLFLGNDEAMNNQFVANVTLDNIEMDSDEWSWDNLFGPSAGMWALFKQQVKNNDEELTHLLKI